MCTDNIQCDTSSLGTSCNKSFNYCECSSDADCQADPSTGTPQNASGSVCHGIYSFCSCMHDADCPSGSTCTRLLRDTDVLLCE
jgi:hypothetical protein